MYRTPVPTPRTELSKGLDILLAQLPDEEAHELLAVLWLGFRFRVQGLGLRVSAHELASLATSQVSFAISVGFVCHMNRSLLPYE